MGTVVEPAGHREREGAVARPAPGRDLGETRALWDSSDPFPEGDEQFAGGFLVEDDHVPAGDVWVKLNEVIAFGSNQVRETSRTAVRRAVDVNDPTIWVALAADRLATLTAGAHRLALSGGETFGGLGPTGRRGTPWKRI